MERQKFAHCLDSFFLFNFQGRQLAQLLDEDTVLMERRQNRTKMLELYMSARNEIDAVHWSGDEINPE